MTQDPTAEVPAAGEDAPLDDLDAAILAALRSVAERGDPVPDGLVDRAQFAVALDEVMAEVATLVDHGDRGLVGVRGDDAETRSLTFSGTEVSVTVMVSRVERGLRRVDGWVDDATSARFLRLRHLGGTLESTVDDAGRFVFDRAEAGPAQFVLYGSGDEPTLVTPTVEL